MAKLTDILSKASSNLWTLLNAESGQGRHEAADGEIIFSKNNICVHSSDGQHLPGYFSIKVHKFLPFSEDGDPHEEATLILSWVPNNFIAHEPNPETSPSKVRAIRRSPSIDPNTENNGIPLPLPLEELASDLRTLDIGRIGSCGPSNGSSLKRQQSVESTHSVSSSTSAKKHSTSSLTNHRRRISESEVESTLKDVFPPEAEVVSFDLRQMKSLRLFFTSSDSFVKQNESSSSSSETNSTGQLVIAGRDGRFKVFHFHFGGLDRLVTVLEDWQFLKKRQKSGIGQRVRNESKSESTPPPTADKQIKQFSVWRPPTLRQDECHIEEGIYSELDSETFHRLCLNFDGSVADEIKLRRIIFFGGVSSRLRGEVWPLLLNRFSLTSTYDERKETIQKDRTKYEELDKRRLRMTPEEANNFWVRVQCTVEKDAPRTDRSNPFFAGDENENILIMKRILLNYAYHNPNVGYTQGMSDLLAPLLIELRDESEAFWCFEGLMERTFFISSPRDSDMDATLTLLRELIRLMNPRFYAHLKSLPDGLELLFTHRWLLLCFKREFPESAALKIWEAAWTRYQTDHFHLFVCLAVIAIYGQEVLDQDMKADEMLFHFSTLTLHMNGDLVLKKARGLLYQFRSLTKIPCTLRSLFLSGLASSSSWDSTLSPGIECVSRKTIHSIHDLCRCGVVSSSSTTIVESTSASSLYV